MTPGPQPELGGASADEPVDTLNCLGQRCPLPVIALAKQLPRVPVGALIRVLADDPAAAVDIPAWCRMRAQEYVGVATVDGAPAFDVRRLS